MGAFADDVDRSGWLHKALFAALMHIDSLVLGPNVMKMARHVQEETVPPSQTA
jgi:chromate transport protein ChrA